MGTLNSFSIKNISFGKMALRLLFSCDYIIASASHLLSAFGC